MAKNYSIDYGAKDNILRNLASLGCKITIVPATVEANDIFKKNLKNKEISEDESKNFEKKIQDLMRTFSISEKFH